MAFECFSTARSDTFEALGNGAVGLALGHFGQDLGLPRGQPLEVRFVVTGPSLDQHVYDLGIDHRSAGRDHANGLGQFVRPATRSFNR